MNIEAVIPCRHVEVHDNLATIVGGWIDTVWVAELPALVQVVLAVRLLATPDEIAEEGEHRVVNRVRTPQGEVLGEGAGAMQIGAARPVRPNWLVGATIPMAAQFQAAEEGTYAIEIEVDDASHSLPIHVVVGQP